MPSENTPQFPSQPHSRDAKANKSKTKKNTQTTRGNQNRRRGEVKNDFERHVKFAEHQPARICIIELQRVPQSRNCWGREQGFLFVPKTAVGEFHSPVNNFQTRDLRRCRSPARLRLQLRGAEKGTGKPPASPPALRVKLFGGSPAGPIRGEPLPSCPEPAIPPFPPNIAFLTSPSGDEDSPLAGSEPRQGRAKIWGKGRRSGQFGARAPSVSLSC